MRRPLYEFERGKGARIDWNQEVCAFYGPRSSYMNLEFKRGPYKRTSRRKGVVYPLRWYPVVRKWDIFLKMRSRIRAGTVKDTGSEPSGERDVASDV